MKLKTVIKAMEYAKENPGKRIRMSAFPGNYDIVFSATVLNGIGKATFIILDENGDEFKKS